MAQPLAIPTMPGVEDVWTLLAVLVDPEAVKARADLLADLETRCTARIAEVGQVGEIEGLVARARADRQMAAEVLDAAKAEVLRIRSSAIDERDAAVVQVARLRQDVAVEQEALRESVRAAERTAQAREAKLAERETEAERSARAAESLMAQAQAIKAEFESRLKRLQAATAEA